MTWDKSDFDDDIKQALKEDRSRGTKRSVPNQEAIKKRKKLRKDARNLLEIDSKKDFISILIDISGLQEGSDQYNRALQGWYDYKPSRKKLNKP